MNKYEEMAYKVNHYDEMVQKMSQYDDFIKDYNEAKAENESLRAQLAAVLAEIEELKNK